MSGLVLIICVETYILLMKMASFQVDDDLHGMILENLALESQNIIQLKSRVDILSNIWYQWN